MLDTLALTALLTQCVPAPSMKALTDIVRSASGAEPLVISTMQNGRPISVLAMSKDEAIALAMEARLAGHSVKVGLTGLDSRVLDRLGATLADAFDPCTNLRLTARLLADDPSALRSPMTARGVSHQPLHPKLREPAVSADLSSPEPPDEVNASPQVRAWDVYRRVPMNTTLIYAAPK